MTTDTQTDSATATDEITAPAEDMSIDEMVDAAYGTIEPADDDEDDKDENEESDDSDEDEDDSAADGEEAKADEAQSDTFALDPKVADALPPEEKKRWEAHVEGLLKREAKVKQSEAQIQVLDSYLSAFEDANHAGPALRQLGELVAKQHGKELADLLGLAPAPEKKAEAPDWKARGYESEADFAAAPDWERAGFDSAGEYKLHLRNESLEQQLREIQEKISPVIEDRAAREKREQHESRVKAVAPEVIAKMSSEHSGWKVTAEMVDKAMQQFPTLPPDSAVEAAYAKEMARHYAASAVKGAPKAEEMLSGEQRKGVSLPPDPTEADINDLVDKAYDMVAR